MAQKIVTFKVAKALKEAGYPQGGRHQYTYAGELLVDLVRKGGFCYGPMAPSYIDAWLWLWREKGIYIHIGFDCCIWFNKEDYTPIILIVENPEEAIASAIDYLIENKLLK